MLRELVSFQSVRGEAEGDQPFGAEVQRAFEYMLARAETDGFDTMNADNWGGHIEWQGLLTDERGEAVRAADETLGIPVHLDVVPAGDGWTADPWGGEIIDGKLYGRGTTDNKGAVCAVYYAMKALRESGYAPKKNVRLILGLDEETGWSGMEKYFAQAPPPDFGFSPDADFPVINGEKGMMTFDIAKKLEPSREKGIHVRGVTGGNAPNMVPDAARAILVFEDGGAGKGRGGRKGKKSGKALFGGSGEGARAYEQIRSAAEAFRGRTGYAVSVKGRGKALEVSVKGVSAHGAQPWLGTNAISILMELLGEFNLANESVRDFLDFYRAHVNYETDGSRLGIAMGDSASGALIVNAGMISLSTEAAILTLNVRYPVSKREGDVYDALRPLIDRYGLGVVKVNGMAPLYFAPDAPLIETLLSVYRDNTGDTGSEPIVIGGGTYARAIPNAVAFGPRFPDEEDVMHQKDEFVRVDSLMRSVHIYADAIFRLAGFRS
jgi:succinyl-diaminopimelate desuccinylase